LGRGLDVGRVLGIPVRLDLTWFLGLLVFTAGTHDVWAPQVTGAGALGLSLGFTLAFFGSVLTHELCHALAARRLGVPTAEITLYVFGGAARITSEPDGPGGEVLMAMAGPLASVVLAGLFALANQLATGWVSQVAWFLGAANLVLAVFNLLPGFPLDGGRVARAVLWKLTRQRLLATRVTAWLGRGLAVLLAAVGSAAVVVEHSPRYLLQILLGAFLFRAAGDGERAARLTDHLHAPAPPRAVGPVGPPEADAAGDGRR
jgi:Zn-dependent protease